MIPIKNVFYMLAYAFRALDRKAYRPLESEDFANAEDLLAAILILGVEEPIQARREQGIHRGGGSPVRRQGAPPDRGIHPDVQAKCASRVRPG